MYIKINLQPMVMEASTKSELLSKIGSGYCHTYTLIKGVRIHGLSPLMGKADHVRVYNLEKHNRKMEHYTERGQKKSRMRNPLYWRAFVYDIPLDVLKTANLSVFQENRNFRLVNRSLTKNIVKQLEKF